VFIFVVLLLLSLMRLFQQEAATSRSEWSFRRIHQHLPKCRQTSQ